MGDDLGGETRPFIMLLLVGALLLAVLLAYGAVWPPGNATIETTSTLVGKASSRTLGKAGITKPSTMVGKANIRIGPTNLEAQPLPQDSSAGGADSDVDSNGFVSCDEYIDGGDTVASRACSIIGSLDEKTNLPEHAARCDYEPL